MFARNSCLKEASKQYNLFDKVGPRGEHGHRTLTHPSCFIVCMCLVVKMRYIIVMVILIHKVLGRVHLALFFCFSLALVSTAQEFVSTENVPEVSEKMALFISTSDSLKKIKRSIKRTLQEDRDTLLAMEYYKLFLKRGEANNNHKIQYYSAYRLGFNFNEIADYPTAVHYANVSLKAAETAKDTTYVIMSNVLIGGIYFQLGIYDKALEPYQIAKNLSQHKEDKINELICLSNIANVRVKLGRDTDALKVYNTTLALLAQDEYQSSPIFMRTHLSTLLGKGRSQTKLGYLNEGMKTYEKGVELASKYGLNHYKGDFYVNMGHLFYKKGEYSDAIKYFFMAKQILNENYNETYINNLIANYYLARCYFDTQKYDEGLELLNRNFELIGTNYKTDKIDEMYDLGINIALQQGDKDKQLFFLTQRKQISKLKLENQTKTRDLLFEDDVKILEDYNRQLGMEKDQNVFRKKVAAAIASGMAILLLLTLFFYKRKIRVNALKFQSIIDNLQQDTAKAPVLKTAPTGSVVKDIQAFEILEKLSNLETSAFFIAKDCNLYTTAKLIDTNTTYLSKTLNTFQKQSFNQYLNELRIKYALIQLKENSRFRAYTIKAISEEVGYKSINTFIKAFKAKTGLSPSYYIKQLQAKLPV